MRALLVPVLVALALPAYASPPTAAEATALASARSWDDLYLKFSAVDPAPFSRTDRAQVAAALLAGARAMADDAVLATSLAERALAFAESTEALLLAAEGNRRLQQFGQSEKWLDRALVLEPKSAPAHLARAALALQENDAQIALAHLAALPRGFEPARVKALRAQAQGKLGEKKAGEEAMRRVELQVQSAASAPPGKAPRAGVRVTPAVASGESVVDAAEGAALTGLRERAGRHFVFAYGNNARDWGQRAEYEGKVMDALEEAYEFVGGDLHANRTQPVTVVLYTKAEFDLHYGGMALSRAAGFFSGKIRINDAQELTPDVRAVIVHEYVHAVVEELNHGGQNCPVWVNEGLATKVENDWRAHQGMPGADAGWRMQLRSMAAAGQLPSLQQLNQSFLAYSNPRVAYATAGKGVELIIERWGTDAFVTLLRDAAQKPYAQLFAERMTPDLASLDADVAAALSK